MSGDCLPRGKCTSLQVEGDGHLFSLGVVESDLHQHLCLISLIALVTQEQLLEFFPTLVIDEDRGDVDFVA